jgi:hypothetical protein
MVARALVIAIAAAGVCAVDVRSADANGVGPRLIKNTFCAPGACASYPARPYRVARSPYGSDFGPYVFGFPNSYRPGLAFGASGGPYGYWGPLIGGGFGY